MLYPFTGLLLSPMFAALAMSLSSASVVGNALRLRAAGFDAKAMEPASAQPHEAYRHFAGVAASSICCLRQPPMGGVQDLDKPLASELPESPSFQMDAKRRSFLDFHLELHRASVIGEDSQHVLPFDPIGRSCCGVLT
ncbi:hypothetical protein HFK18_12925|nr:hypothetical protein [Stenotrophomonas sp. SbOxS2]